MKLNLIHGNIAEIPADVIVNSANKQLWRGSGVCGVIHAAAGPELEKECIAVKNAQCPAGLSVGELVVTSAHKLPARYVFHTLGPRQGRDDTNLLKNCYINCIKKAEELKQKSISFPAISTNIYGVPIDFSAKIVKDVIENLDNPKYLEIINLVFLKENDLKVYREIINQKD